MPSRFSRAKLTLARYGRPVLLLLVLPLLLAAEEPGIHFPGWTWGPGIQFPGWTLPLPDTVTIISKAPPGPFREVLPPAPLAPAGYFVWDPGHWVWGGEDFVWIAGRYVERPYRGSTWVPARWADDEHQGLWTYTPGHWR